MVKLTRVDLLLVNLLNHKKCDLVHVTNKTKLVAKILKEIGIA